MSVNHPIRVAAVSYVNTFPFIYGLQRHDVIGQIDLQVCNPAECARRVLAGEVDLGLVPVAVIPLMKEAHIISDHCIGANGAVNSVCLFSEVPIDDVTEILLDHESRTSVQLMRLLADNYFLITPKWTNASPNYINEIKGTTAGVVIGDRAFALRQRFPVVIDLALEWQNYTCLPFVFACWVSNVALPPAFLAAFNEALSFGVQHRTEAVRSHQLDNEEAMVHYVNNHISYPFDEDKREALKLFTQWSSLY